MPHNDNEIVGMWPCISSDLVSRYKGGQPSGGGRRRAEQGSCPQGGPRFHIIKVNILLLINSMKHF